jgi:hypothetical protein
MNKNTVLETISPKHEDCVDTAIILKATTEDNPKAMQLKMKVMEIVPSGACSLSTSTTESKTSQPYNV